MPGHFIDWTEKIKMESCEIIATLLICHNLQILRISCEQSLVAISTAARCRALPIAWTQHPGKEELEKMDSEQ